VTTSVEPEIDGELGEILTLLATIAPAPTGLRGDTRERLLDAAMEMFAERGFTATSIRSVCKAVAITPAAFYSHFSSKEEVLGASLARIYTTFFTYVFVDGGAAAENDLLTIARRHMEYQFAYPTLAETGKRFLYNANPHIPGDVAESVSRVRLYYRNRIVGAIRLRGGAIYVPVERLAEAVIAVCDQVSYGPINGDHPNDGTVIPHYLRMIEALVDA
jgi:AcrR family transcriptional regulator